MTSYQTNNNNKKNAVSDLVKTIEKKPISKIESYDAIIIETERLLKREQTIFIISSVATFGILITLFKVI